MSIHFSAKNVKLTGALKAYTEKFLKNLEKIAGNIIEAEIIINEEKISYRAEVSLKTSLSSFYAEASDRLLKQALRLALASLKTQAKKNKEKLKEGKKHSSGKAKVQPVPRLTGESKLARNGIVISENFSRKPISVEEAVFFLKESGESGYMFINAETGRTASVFLNSDGNITLIEPKL